MKKFEIEVDRKYAPYIDLFGSAELLLDEYNRRLKWEAQHPTSDGLTKDDIKDNAGSRYLRYAAIVVLASTIEAFANSFGEVLFENWISEFEGKPTKDKLKVICKKLEIDCDYGEYPFSEFGNLTRIRNSIVHAKYENIEGVVFESEMRYPYVPKSKLDKDIDSVNLKKSLDAFIYLRDKFCDLDLNKYVLDEFKDRYLFLIGHTWSTVTKNISNINLKKTGID